MIEKVEKSIKAIAIFMMVLTVVVVGLVLWISRPPSKDLIKKGLLQSAVIEQNNLTFEVQEDYASGLTIRYNSQTIYSQGLGRKVSKLTIENYPSVIDENKIYNLMLYHYDLGGSGFSGFDFCISNDKILYGRDLRYCLKNNSLN